MRPASMTETLARRARRVSAIAAVCLSALALVVAQQAPAKKSSAPAPAPSQMTFASAQAAADALIAAAGNYDPATLTKIFGPDGKDIVETGEPAREKQRAAEFAAKAGEKTVVSADPKNPNRATLVIGNDDWPFPVPIVKRSGKWLFDSKAGVRELLYRRIGSNELDAISICRGYVDAQYDYAFQKRQDYAVNQYAQRIVSTPGTQDGLAWQNPDGTWGGPVGENVAKAIEQGYSKRTEPYHGYFFKILKGQGPAAPLGAMDYMVKGLMIGGFALVAAPAEYRVSGVKTFIVSNDGVVFEKDLGPQTLEEFQKMERFNPDKSWTPVMEDDDD